MKLVLIAIAAFYTLCRGLLAFKLEPTPHQMFQFVLGTLLTGLVTVGALEQPEV